jgi:hypothetical protein
MIGPIIAFNKGLLGGVMLVRAVTREHALKMPARKSQLCQSAHLDAAGAWGRVDRDRLSIR